MLPADTSPHAAGVRIVSPAKDQGSCNTSVVLVLTAALETALAAALREAVTDMDFSRRGLAFCSEEQGSTVVRSCSSPWSINGAIAAIQRLQAQATQA